MVRGRRPINNSAKREAEASASKNRRAIAEAENIKKMQGASDSNSPKLSTKDAENNNATESLSVKPIRPIISSHQILSNISKDNQERISQANYIAKNQQAALHAAQNMYTSNRIQGQFSVGNSQTVHHIDKNTSAKIHLPESTKKDDAIVRLLEQSTKRLEDIVKISNSLLTEEQKKTHSLSIANNKLGEKIIAGITGAGSAGGGGGGGGDGGGTGGGGFSGFLARLGQKDRLGFRGGIAGQVISTVGNVINSGVNAALNYQQQMATAPVETYSNIASLKGFQQRRFLRDLTDFSPEAQVLRNRFLRTDQSDVTNRIDKIAKETTEKKDKAELNAALKDTITNVGSQVAAGVTAGAGSGGKVGAIVGGVTGGISGIAQEVANAPNNPVFMRNQKILGDLYLKNRTAFDAQNIMQNTSALESAVLENSQIDIAVQREYQKTLGARTQAARSGRYLDVYGQANEFFVGDLGYNTQGNKLFFDQSTQIKKMAGGLYKPGQESRNFTDTLIKMGFSVGSAEAESVMSQFANIGGAGAGQVQQKDFQALERVRKMSESGRGPADLLLGQAGLLGRISGGVSAEQNIKKLEEVLGRAVAIGMDNSELGSAFVQNVQNMSAQMKSGDVGAMAALVQKMQSAGGGQLVDFDRMNRNVSAFDAQRQQNFGIKTYARENVASALNKFVESGVLSTGDAATALTTIGEMSSKDLIAFESTAKKYAGAKTEEQRLKAVSNVSPALRNFMLTLKPEQIKKMGIRDFSSSIKNAFGAAAAGMSPEEFKETFGVMPSDISKADLDTRTKFAQRVQSFQGGSAGAALDTLKLFGVGDLGVGGVTDEQKQKEQEKRLATSQKEAAAKTALALGAKGSQSIGKTMLGIDSSTGAYQELIRQSGINADEQGKLSDVLQKYYSPDGVGDKSKATGVEKSIIEKLEKTVEQAEGAEDVTSVADRPGGGMSAENAAIMGKEFAKAFFDYAGQKPGLLEQTLGSFSKVK